MTRQLLMLLGACLQGDTSYASAASLQMHAAVAGLGPAFKIKLMLQNTGTSVVRNLPVVRHGACEVAACALMLALHLPASLPVAAVGSHEVISCLSK